MYKLIEKELSDILDFPISYKDGMISKAKEEEKKGLVLKFIKVDKKEFVVGGIVTACEEVDTQGDVVSKGEIWKAMKGWMIKGGKIKVMHEGLPLNIPVVECYQSDEIHHKGGIDDEHLVRKGDWYASLFLGMNQKTKKIFDRIVKGELNAFSIGGSADARKA